MDPASIARLVLLSAIWGASFLFIRVGAPVLGPSLLIFFRVGLAALFLLAVALHLKRALEARRHWRHYLTLGLFNSALPFLLFAYAAQAVSASLLSILNATAPIWAAAIAGLLLGIAGVALLAGVETLSLPAGGGVAILAALGAACCYGLMSAYARSAAAIEPFANAHGSMWAATLLLIPAALFAPWPASPPDGRIFLAVVALGVLCSGVAYLLYFRLIADLGASSALTVTFLIPVFGILWGVLFLDETVGWHTLAGSALVLAGTALATGFSIRGLFARAEANRA